jgi:hypothetical protein
LKAGEKGIWNPALKPENDWPHGFQGRNPQALHSSLRFLHGKPLMKAGLAAEQSTYRKSGTNLVVYLSITPKRGMDTMKIPYSTFNKIQQSAV